MEEQKKVLEDFKEVLSLTKKYIILQREEGIREKKDSGKEPSSKTL